MSPRMMLFGVMAAWLAGAVDVRRRSQRRQTTHNRRRPISAAANFLPTKVYSEADDLKTLKLFEGLRVADVSDGMDRAGLADMGLVAAEIAPLWRDTEHYSHRFVGIAVTARYVPTNKPAAGRRTKTEDFDQWVGQWYAKLSPEPFVPLFRKGSVLVIEEAEEADVGSIGSNNILGWKLRGCVGVVTSGTARDTDEIAAERVPLYYKQPGRGIRPGRNEIESVNRPVVVGGVTVMPGDVIVADGDGVVVVPVAQRKKWPSTPARRSTATSRAGRSCTKSSACRRMIR